jgi:energy-coupling factor transporter ATP-binding protein EcfA2
MPKIIFITGPSGSGKTTTATEVAQAWPKACALLRFDQIRTFIAAGYAEPADGWNKETEHQWAIAKGVVGTMAKEYLANDLDVVIEAYSNPHDYPTWQAVFGLTGYVTFALLPPVEVVIARNSARFGVAKLAETDIKQNYEWSIGWRDVKGVTVFDNSNIELDEIAKKIISLSNRD